MTKAAELAKMGEVLTNSQIGGRRNIAYNGAMQISQRATSATGLGGDGSNGYFTVDRFGSFSAGTAGRYTQSQAAITDLPGFANALKFDCTTADTSIAAGEYLILQQNFEGQDLQQIKKGTSSAEKVTVSFYVKGNANATYALELLDVDNSRTTAKLFNVTSSWNRISLTFDADTTGAFDDDTAESLRLFWWLHGGSTYTGGTLNTTWASSSTSANRVAGISSFFDSTDREFFITGVQFELGSQATPFEHRSLGEELNLCRRYYNEYSGGTNAHRLYQYNYNSSYKAYLFYFPIKMRAAPTVALSGNGSTGTAGILNENYMFRYISGGVDVATAYYLYDFSFDAEL